MELQTQTVAEALRVRRRPASPEEASAVELWSRYRVRRDVATRNALIETYVPLVRCEARRLSAALANTVSVQELESAGTLGLIDSIAHFDQRQGFKFITYCTPRIRGAMFDELRTWDWTPRATRAKLNRLERASKALDARLGRAPEEEEIAREMGLSDDELRQLRWSRNRSLLSMSQAWEDEGTGANEETPAASIEDRRGTDPVLHLQKKELVGVIQRTLTKTERLVVTLYYYEHLKMHEIGAVLGVTESRVSQIRTKILAKLAKCLG